MPYVYLVQPKYYQYDLFKIGCSQKNGTKRISSYGKDSRIIILYDTKNSIELENQLKKSFTLKFTLFDGKEIFKGNEADMKKEINLNLSCYFYKTLN